MKPSVLGETGFLSALGLFGRTLPAGWVGPGDDAAVIPPLEGGIVFSSDIMTEGVHFRRNTSSPADVGYKALAVNVSDMAAMGARPVAATVSLNIPSDAEVEWFKGFYEGMAGAEREFECPVVGGDLSAGSEIVVSVAIIGQCGPKGPVLRSGAKPGQGLYLTGETGLSAAGLGFLENPAIGTNSVPEAVKRHLRPEPRLAFGRLASSKGLLASMIDVSDGVVRDAGHIARMSGILLEIDQGKIFLSEDLVKAASILGSDPLKLALSGGEDYELLFTADLGHEEELFVTAGEAGLRLMRIGRVLKGEGVTLLGPDGEPLGLTDTGFDHFASSGR